MELEVVAGLQQDESFVDGAMPPDDGSLFKDPSSRPDYAVMGEGKGGEGKGGEAAADGGDAEDAVGDTAEGKGGGEDAVASADGATDAVAEEEAEAPPPAKKKGPEAVPWLFPSAEVAVRLTSKGGATDDIARLRDDHVKL